MTASATRSRFWIFSVSANISGLWLTLTSAKAPSKRVFWARGLLHQLRHRQEERVVRTLEALLTSTAGLPQETQTAARAPSEYFQTRREHIHYSKVAGQGGSIDIGSVESLCSQLRD